MRSDLPKDKFDAINAVKNLNRQRENLLKAKATKKHVKPVEKPQNVPLTNSSKILFHCLNQALLKMNLNQKAKSVFLNSLH